MTTLTSARKMRRILARSVTFRISSPDCRVFIPHKLRKPTITQSLLTGLALPECALPSITKQSSCFERTSFKIGGQEKDLCPIVKERIPYTGRLSMKLPKTDKLERFLSIERIPPFSSAPSKASFKQPYSPIRREKASPLTFQKESDALSLTPRTKCSEGSDQKQSFQDLYKQKIKESKSSPKLAPSPSLKRAKWFAKSKRGRKPMTGATINQDCYFVKEDLAGIRGTTFMGVCDGHGSAGHLLSQHVSLSLSNYLTALLKDYLGENKYSRSQWGFLNSTGTISEKFKFLIENQDPTDIEQLLKMAFVSTQKALTKEDFDWYKSGTTACTLLMTPSTLFCANSGDSRAVLGMKEGMFWQAEALSRDHKPAEEDERRRIIACNGRVQRISGGSLRVWLQDKLEPGLAMSRSIGDKLAHKVGVISAPEVCRRSLRSKDKFVIIGSDGLWDKVTNKEAVRIVGQYWDEGRTDAAANGLIQVASKKWKEERDQQEYYIDDITAVVVVLE